MATSTILLAPSIPSSAALKAAITAFGNAFRAMSDITQITGLLSMGIAGGGQVDMTDKTGTGVTTTASSVNFSGTFSGGGLSQSDVGRRIIIPGAGAAGAEYFGFIASVTSATTGKLGANASTGIAGSGTATIGVLASTTVGTETNWIAREMYRFNDALQATCPIFFSVVYGYYGLASNTAQPCFRFQVGAASSGYGDLAGPASDTFEILYSWSGQGEITQKICHFSNEPGRFTFSPFSDSTSLLIRGIFSIKRLVDNSGNNDSRGVNILSKSPSDGTRQQFLSKDGSVFPATSMADFMAGTPPAGGITTSAIFDGNTGIFPIQPFLGREDNPAMDAVIVRSGDYGHLSDVTVSMYGSNRKFKTIVLSSASNAGTATTNLAIRWD